MNDINVGPVEALAGGTNDGKLLVLALFVGKYDKLKDGMSEVISLFKLVGLLVPEGLLEGVPEGLFDGAWERLELFVGIIEGVIEGVTTGNPVNVIEGL